MSPEDITDDIKEYCDKFFKKVIRTAALNYLRTCNKTKKYGLSIVHIEDIENITESVTDDPPYAIDRFQFKEAIVKITDPNLGQALRTLTISQRSVIVQNIVFGYTMAEIADELHISLRTVQKHKYNALVKLKEAIDHEENQS